MSGLTADGQGNFFVVSNGGERPRGYALELVPQGNRLGAQVIHKFHLKDGSVLYGDALVRDAAGNLFGIAAYGGTHNEGSAYEL